MITDEQVRLLRKKMAEGKTIASGAAAAGISERSAYSWKQGALPSDTRTPRAWRTRPDPFAAIWQSDIVPLLVADEHGVLEGTTILAELRRRHGEAYGGAHLVRSQHRHKKRGLSSRFSGGTGAVVAGAGGTRSDGEFVSGVSRDPDAFLDRLRAHRGLRVRGVQGCARSRYTQLSSDDFQVGSLLFERLLSAVELSKANGRNWPVAAD